MATLEWDVERTDGVTLVRAYVTASRARRVRVENCLDGPVWPPRRRGQPAAGWDEDGFEGVVRPDERLAVGYATPAPPADPPVELVDDEPAAADGTDDADPFDARAVRSVESTPAGVVRSLGDPVVPRDAVPVPDPETVARDPAARDEPGPGDGTAREHAAEGDGPPETGADERDAAGDAGPTGTRHAGDGFEGDRQGRSGVAGSGSVGTPVSRESGDALVVPGAVRAWLADVERRVVAAERRVGHRRPGSAVGAATATDRRALARVGRRVDALLDRLGHVDPPQPDGSGAFRDRSGGHSGGTPTPSGGPPTPTGRDRARSHVDGGDDTTDGGERDSPGETARQATGETASEDTREPAREATGETARDLPGEMASEATGEMAREATGDTPPRER